MTESEESAREAKTMPDSPDFLPVAIGDMRYALAIVVSVLQGLGTTENVEAWG